MILEYDSARSALTPRDDVVRVPARTSLAVIASITSRPAGRVGLGLLVCVCSLGLLAPLLAVSDPFALVGDALTAPSMTHWMGTDALGRDVMSGVIAGTRTSLTIAAAVSVLTFVCGTAIGVIGGYAGGWADEVLLRLTEVLQVLPRFFLVIVVVALFGPGMLQLVLTLGLTSWPVLARVVRGEVLALRRAEFVIAAEAVGATPAEILWRSVLPNVIPVALVIVGLLFGQVLLIEASLGFLGLGDPNAMSWGLMAGQAQPLLRDAWWLALFPGVAITSAVLGANLLADAVSEALGGR